MGTYEHGLDAKGRVIIPAKLREDLGESFVVTLGLDGCLFAYPMNEWEGFIEKLKELPGTKEARMLQRHFLANAAPCELDKQGRILVPATLREFAGLEKDVVLTGNINRIEISDRSIEKCLRKLIKLQKKYPNIINEYRNHKKNKKGPMGKTLIKIRQKKS